MVNKWYGTDAKVLSDPCYIYVSILKQTKSTEFDIIREDKTGRIRRSN
jgi:hypothetical protein